MTMDSVDDDPEEGQGYGHTKFLGMHTDNFFLCGNAYCISNSDDGIPPGCHHICCPLDPRFMTTIRCQAVADYISTIGFHYFDIHRKFYLGIASYITVISFLATIWGCFALSADADIVEKTFWIGSTGTNTETGNDYELFLGLRSIVYHEDGLDRTSVEWGYYSDITGYIGEKCQEGILKESCDECAIAASSLWCLCVSACASLILSFLGAQSRLRGKVADFPIQKILGMFSEMNGFVSLIMG